MTHKTAHVGNRVQVGEPLLAIVPLGKLYLTANFKETQLTDVRVGQKAEIVADIYPDYTYRGHVDSISMGTGAAFSLLPPENATGNWVKVVQRVPVKIVIEGPEPQDKPLRLGLSVEVAIDLNDRSGPLLSSIMQQRYQKNGQTLPNETLKMVPSRERRPNRRRTPERSNILCIALIPASLDPPASPDTRVSSVATNSPRVLRCGSRGFSARALSDARPWRH